MKMKSSIKDSKTGNDNLPRISSADGWFIDMGQERSWELGESVWTGGSNLTHQTHTLIDEPGPVAI